MDRLRVGVVGCGQISGKYLENMTGRFAYCLEVAACADLVEERARARAEEFKVPRVCSVEEMLADSTIDAVVNLTVPTAHYAISLAALEAGKHVYTEKQLAVERTEGLDLVQCARSKGLLLGGAPDTFLGAGLQTCRKLVDEGWIGRPVAATGLIAMGGRTERYHKRGIGPMFDMGPYYITALVALLGPVRRVSASAQIPFPEKENGDPSSPEFGRRYTVDTPTVVSGVLDMADGTVATISTTCEVFGYNPRLEIYGTEGILVCNDPNMFSGPLLLKRRDGQQKEVPFTHGYAENSRGLGVADMVYARRDERPLRASGDLMYHVLDVMHAIHEASREGRAVNIESTVDRPAPFRPGLLSHVLE